MVVLAMTSLLPDLKPPVLLDHSNDVPDLHGTSVSGENNKFSGSIRWSIVWSIVGTYRHLFAGPFYL